MFQLKAAEVEVAIYECDWHSAPMEFRTLVLMFLQRCKKPIIVSAKPFYEISSTQLAKVNLIALICWWYSISLLLYR